MMMVVMLAVGTGLRREHASALGLGRCIAPLRHARSAEAKVEHS